MHRKTQIAAAALAVGALLLTLTPVLRAQGTVPAGKTIVVTIDQAISSKDAKVGEAVPATVADNVVVNGRVVIPKGSAATVHVASVQASGRLSTPAKLWLQLDSVTANGKAYPVSAHWAGETMGSHAKRNTVAIGGLLRSVLHTHSQRAEEAAMRRKALEALAFVGLRGKEFAGAKSLPYGQQRLLELARALRGLRRRARKTSTTRRKRSLALV
jgi:hypothetical protein